MTKRTITLFICLLVLTVLLILNGTVFVVKDVTVTDYYGQELPDKQEIIKFSKLKDNNIFTVSENTAIENIESSMPNINVIEIIRSFPSSIKIVVNKRIPILAVSNGTSGYTILDRECMVITNVNTLEEYDNISIVEGVSCVQSIPGKEFVSDVYSVVRLKQIVEAFEQIGEQGYRDGNFCLVVNKITLVGDEISIKMTEGVELRFNASVDCFNKLLSLVSYFNFHEDKRAGGVLTVGSLNESGGYNILEAE